MVRCWYIDQLGGDKCRIKSSLDVNELKRVTNVIYFKVKFQKLFV